MRSCRWAGLLSVCVLLCAPVAHAGIAPDALPQQIRQASPLTLTVVWGDSDTPLPDEPQTGHSAPVPMVTATFLRTAHRLSVAVDTSATGLVASDDSQLAYRIAGKADQPHEVELALDTHTSSASSSLRNNMELVDNQWQTLGIAEDQHVQQHDGGPSSTHTRYHYSFVCLGEAADCRSGTSNTPKAGDDETPSS